jgi:hypothetical protein
VSQNPFVADQGVDKPGIVGARWWNASVVESGATRSRRAAMIGVAVGVVGVTALVGFTVFAAARSGKSDEDTRDEARKSLDLQRDFGWNFGATSETVAFEQAYTQAYARDALKTLVIDLEPKRAEHKPYYVSSLFQSPEAMPRLTTPDGETSKVRPIAESLKPINTPAMIEAQGIGLAVAAALSKADRPVALIVDLIGAVSVAFAAGAADAFDPVFVFDNWPHPRGVVHAHLPLAAAVFHQPAFRKAAGSRPDKAPPLFVLDRTRLAAYTDAPTVFDNRYVAKLPDSSWLKGLGIERALYVVASSSDLPERGDLNATLVAWAADKIDVRALALAAFRRPAADGPFQFDGKDDPNALLERYGWGGEPAPAGLGTVATNDNAERWRPMPRSRSVSSSPAPQIDGVDLTTVGVTTVAVGLATGYVLGRSGTWNRSPSGSWGGG